MRLGSHEAARVHGPGYVYVASNEFMPCVVKIGRTQGLVDDRLRAPYVTGVPGRFKAEGKRFFVDCYDGERLVHQAISRLGTRCPNREFYKVERTLAVNILEAIYETQHDRIQPHVFEWQIEEAFQSCLSKGDMASAEHSFNATEWLPHDRREELRLRLLVRALLQREERVAIWLVHSKRVNPNVTIRSPFQGMCIPMYDLTAFESFESGYEHSLFHWPQVVGLQFDFRSVTNLYTYQGREPRQAWRAIFVGVHACLYWTTERARKMGTLSLRSLPLRLDSMVAKIFPMRKILY